MQQNFIQQIKFAYKRSGVIGQLIAVSLVVHLIFGLGYVVESMFIHPDIIKSGAPSASEIFKGKWLAAPGNPELLLYKPWTLITQLFTHGDFMHLAFNMIGLYFTSSIFVQFFGEKRLVSTYFLAGIFAYLFHIGCYYLIPAFKVEVVNGLVGASGSIMAIFTAIAIYKPSFKVMLFGVIKMPLILIAAIYIFIDLRSAFSPDGIAHLAHIGGAVFGAVSVINVNSSKNFMNRFDKWFSKIKWPSFKRKPKMKVYKSAAKEMTDEEYNKARRDHQLRVDAILDKISKKGYEGLSKEEKEILFNESKRN